MTDLISTFAAKFPARNFSKEEIILQAGERPDHLFYLRSGYVRRFVNSLEGRELTIHIFEKGTLFPVSWALNAEVPDFSLATLTQIEVNIVPTEEFVKFMEENPKELMRLTKRMAMAVEGLARRVELLSLEKADVRVKSTIKYLGKHFGEILPFTHEDIATLTGLSRERVSIEMKKLKDNNDISYKRGEIVIKITDK